MYSADRGGLTDNRLVNGVGEFPSDLRGARLEAELRVKRALTIPSL